MKINISLEIDKNMQDIMLQRNLWLQKFFFICIVSLSVRGYSSALVIQSDMGGEGMGLIFSTVYQVTENYSEETEDLRIFAPNVYIKPFDIFDAAYSLSMQPRYWPKGTVFLSTVDSIVDSKQVVLRTKFGHYIVAPNNGSLDLVAERYGVDEARIIEPKLVVPVDGGEAKKIYGGKLSAYVATKLAAGLMQISEVGPKFAGKFDTLEYRKPYIKGNVAYGMIVYNNRHGNILSNIPDSMVQEIGIEDGDTVCVEIYKNMESKYSGKLLYLRDRQEKSVGEITAYSAENMHFVVLLNSESFAAKYKIGRGIEWRMRVRLCDS